MRYARIQDGVVAELVELEGDPAECFHPSLVFVPAPEGCAEGWVVQGGVPVAPPVDLAALRTARHAAIEAAFTARITAGLAFAGKVYQVDDESRLNIQGIALRAGLMALGVPGITWPEGGYSWRTLDNSWTPLSVAQFLAMAQAAADLYTAIRVRYGNLKDALAAAADQAAIAAIDPAAGWPS
jgi:Domain of unknown function (DUF4376)